jgi:hypothetical protein
MGFWDFVEAATPWSTVEAEAPAKEEEVCILLFPFSVAGMGDWEGRGGAKSWKGREEEMKERGAREEGLGKVEEMGDGG